MKTHIVCLISLIQLFFQMVIPVGFGDHHDVGEFFSDIFDPEPIIESSIPLPNGLSSQDKMDSSNNGDNLVYVNQALLHELDGIYPDYYHMSDFNEMYHLLLNQEERAPIETEASSSSNMKGRNILPREEDLSMVTIENNTDRIHQKELVDPLIQSKQHLRLHEKSVAIGVTDIQPRDKHLMIDSTGNNVARITQKESIEPLVTSEQNSRSRKHCDDKHKSYSLIDENYQKKPKYQGNKELVNISQDPNDHNRHFSVQENTLSSVLQWQGKLLLAKRYEISEEIESFFKDLQESLTQKLDDTSKLEWIGNKNNLHVAIETIRTDFVMGTLGASKIVFQRHAGMSLMNSLLLDLWKYLQVYLKEELTCLPKENMTIPSERESRQTHFHIEPGKLLEHTLNLKGLPISSKIVHQKLNEWLTESSYKGSVPDSVTDYWAFLAECDVCYKQKGYEKTFYRKTDQNRNKTTDVRNIVGNDQENKTTSPGPILTTAQIVKVLKKEGSQIVTTDEFKNFFWHLHNDIRPIDKPKMEGEANLESVSKGIDIISKDMVHKAISKAQHQITPAFLGILRLMYSGIEFSSTWDVIAHNGWEFLKEYFSTWTRYFSEMDQPIVLKPPVRVTADKEWSDLKETLHYLGHKIKGQTIPQGLLWFLVDLWYDETNFPESNGKVSPGFKALQPHRQQILQMCHQLKGRIDH
ncbi:hypothetical protein DFH28DRAFT_948965 [Melampsora americana]|nr:hypothetical protein DFH28DRAFT_948965 [Melampsora americana]